MISVYTNSNEITIDTVSSNSISHSDKNNDTIIDHNSNGKFLFHETSNINNNNNINNSSNNTNRKDPIKKLINNNIGARVEDLIVVEEAADCCTNLQQDPQDAKNNCKNQQQNQDQDQEKLSLYHQYNQAHSKRKNPIDNQPQLRFNQENQTEEEGYSDIFEETDSDSGDSYFELDEDDLVNLNLNTIPHQLAMNINNQQQHNITENHQKQQHRATTSSNQSFCQQQASASQNETYNEREDQSKRLYNQKQLQTHRSVADRLQLPVVASSNNNHDSNRKQNHCEIEKRRRDKMNHYIMELASIIPVFNDNQAKFDKLTVLRMAVQHVRSLRSSLCSFSSFHLRPPFLSSGNLLKNLILQMASQEAQDNLFMVVSCDRGKVLFVSESSKDILNQSQNELVGQYLFDMLHKDDVTRVKEQISYFNFLPREMLVDSKTFQPIKNGQPRQSPSQLENKFSSTPQPGARRSFFCRMKSGRQSNGAIPHPIGTCSTNGVAGMVVKKPEVASTTSSTSNPASSSSSFSPNSSEFSSSSNTSSTISSTKTDHPDHKSSSSNSLSSQASSSTDKTSAATSDEAQLNNVVIIRPDRVIKPKQHSKRQSAKISTGSLHIEAAAAVHSNNNLINNSKSISSKSSSFKSKTPSTKDLNSNNNNIINIDNTTNSISRKKHCSSTSTSGSSSRQSSGTNSLKAASQPVRSIANYQPISCRASIDLASRKGWRYIVMHCTGYLKCIMLNNDEIDDDEFDGYDQDNNMQSNGIASSSQSSSIHQDVSSSNGKNLASNQAGSNANASKTIMCLVAVCRRSPMDLSFKPDQPLTFTCRYSMEGKFVFVDQKTTIALGYTPQQLLGSSHYAYCTKESVNTFKECHRQCILKSEAVSSDIYQFKRANGQFLWLQTSLKSFRNPWTKFIDYIVANHTTAGYPEPAASTAITSGHQHNASFNDATNSSPNTSTTSQDLQEPGSQSSSPASSSLISIDSKKSNSPGSTSNASSYSLDSCASSTSINAILSHIDRIKPGGIKNVFGCRGTVEPIITVHTNKQQQQLMAIVNKPDQSGGSGNGKPSDDSGAYSETPSCSSLSSRNSNGTTNGDNNCNMDYQRVSKQKECSNHGAQPETSRQMQHDQGENGIATRAQYIQELQNIQQVPDQFVIEAGNESSNNQQTMYYNDQPSHCGLITPVDSGYSSGSQSNVSINHHYGRIDQMPQQNNGTSISSSSSSNNSNLRQSIDVPIDQQQRMYQQQSYQHQYRHPNNTIQYRTTTASNKSVNNITNDWNQQTGSTAVTNASIYGISGNGRNVAMINQSQCNNATNEDNTGNTRGQKDINTILHQDHLGNITPNNNSRFVNANPSDSSYAITGSQYHADGNRNLPNQYNINNLGMPTSDLIENSQQQQQRRNSISANAASEFPIPIYQNQSQSTLDRQTDNQQYSQQPNFGQQHEIFDNSMSELVPNQQQQHQQHQQQQQQQQQQQIVYQCQQCANHRCNSSQRPAMMQHQSMGMVQQSHHHHHHHHHMNNGSNNHNHNSDLNNINFTTLAVDEDLDEDQLLEYLAGCDSESHQIYTNNAALVEQQQQQVPNYQRQQQHHNYSNNMYR